MNRSKSLLLLCSTLVLAGCFQSSSDEDPPATQPPEVNDNVLALAADNNVFAMDLYQQLQQQEGNTNLFFSPYSVSATLAMLHAGSREQTAIELAEVLHFQLEPADLHAGFRDLNKVLNDRGSTLASGDDLHLLNANSMWFDEEQPLLEDFVSILDLYHGSHFYQVDFQSEPETARQDINHWVADQTEEQLVEVLPEGSVNQDTRLVLLNALHFAGDWLEPFDDELTEPGDFTTLAGDVVSTPMLQSELLVQYTQGDFYEAIQLDYVGQELSMLLVVPEPGQFETVQDNLDTTLLQSIHDNLSNGLVELALPEFELQQDMSLQQALYELGLEQVFDPNSADLSGINDDYTLVLDDIMQQAVIHVDAEGTEAAAATGAVVREISQPEQLATVTIDRPFMFFIQDNETQTILFAGQLVEPTVTPES